MSVNGDVAMNVREQFRHIDEREKLIREMLDEFCAGVGPLVTEDIKFGFVVGCRAAFYKLIHEPI
jgi:hypothetical protein